MFSWRLNFWKPLACIASKISTPTSLYFATGTFASTKDNYKNAPWPLLIETWASGGPASGSRSQCPDCQSFSGSLLYVLSHWTLRFLSCSNIFLKRGHQRIDMEHLGTNLSEGSVNKFFSSANKFFNMLKTDSTGNTPIWNKPLYCTAYTVPLTTSTIWRKAALRTTCLKL